MTRCVEDRNHTPSMRSPNRCYVCGAIVEKTLEQPAQDPTIRMDEKLEPEEETNNVSEYWS